MSDQPAPVQPSQPDQQAIDWEARYKGASTKINELTGTVQRLQEQLTAKLSETEQAKAQLGVKDVEKDSAVSEYQRQLNQMIQERDTLSRENASLKSTVTKIEMAKKLGAPQLLQIIDKIPYVENPEAQETIMKSFMDWGNDLASQREKQLLAGVTPASTQAPVQAAGPQSQQEWERILATHNVGSPEHTKAWDAYWQWLSKSGK